MSLVKVEICFEVGTEKECCEECSGHHFSGRHLSLWVLLMLNVFKHLSHR